MIKNITLYDEVSDDPSYENFTGDTSKSMGQEDNDCIRFVPMYKGRIWVLVEIVCIVSGQVVGDVR